MPRTWILGHEMAVHVQAQTDTSGSVTERTWSTMARQAKYDNASAASATRI